MEVLIVGSGGREHALGWQLAKSSRVKKIYFAPGNGGTSRVGKNLDIAMDDTEGLLKFAKRQHVTLTVVGQEAALERGIVDSFTAAGLRIFGPTRRAAQIETSKAFSSDFLQRHSIPHPEFTTVSSLAAALEFVKSHDPKDFVIKADGLATGKGVILPKSQAEAEQTAKDMLAGKAFGEAGKQIVFQERLNGQEVSAFGISDGKSIAMLPYFQDHKPVFDEDKGPNTGGMGAYSPVPIVTEQLSRQIETEIMQPAIAGLARDGAAYTGVLYAGLMITDSGPKVIEFNARFGDPEAQAMMLLLEADLCDLLSASADGKLPRHSLAVRPGAAVTVALASGGYPGEYKKGLPITGIDKAEADPDVVVFHAGTKQEGKGFVTNGGRVLNVTAYGDDLKSAITKAYRAAKKIRFKGIHYRTDIGAKAIS